MTTEALTTQYSKQSYVFPVVLIAALMAWFVSIVILTLVGVFNMTDATRPLPILLAVSVPPILLILSYRTFTPVRDWVQAIDIRLLILPHTLRMIGMGFIFLYFYDSLPALFVFPAGLGDAAAAVVAMVLTGRFLLGLSVTNAVIRRWNYFAFLDFIVAVSLGVLTRSNGLLQFEGHPVSDPMGLFPLALIPGFFVPLYISTHIMIWLKLRQDN